MEKKIHKTIIEYRKIPKNKEKLKQLGEDLWLPAFSEEDGWILYKKKMIEVKKVLTAHEGGFENFWELYPKKKGKTYTEQKFFLLKECEIPNVIAGLEEHIKSWDKEIKTKQLKYIPDASKFLNQRMWEDEVILDQEQISHLQANKMRAQKKLEEDKAEEEKRKNIQDKRMIDDKIKFLEENEPDTIQAMRDNVRSTTIKNTPIMANNLQVLERHVENGVRIEVRKKYFKTK